jgi:hypothetical protein
LIEVREKRYGDDSVDACLEIELPERPRASVDDAAVGERRGFDVEGVLMRLLFEIVTLVVDGIDVHDAITIGEEVDAAFPDHGIVRGAGIVRGKWHGFAVTIVAPEVLCGAPPCSAW